MAENVERVSVAVAGICGRMGMETAGAILEDPAIELSLGLERPGHPLAGRTLNLETGDGSGRVVVVPVVEVSSADLAGVRVIVDFSAAAVAADYAELCASSGIAYVGGVTGLSESEMNKLRAAGERVPVVYSPNMSAGVSLLNWLVGETARRIPGGYDIEIVESHHKAKVDVPSGTAAMLARRAARARGDDEKVIEISRPPGGGKRDEGKITVHSLRGGDVAGEHQVSFIGVGETLTLSHRAHSRKAFARGVPPAIKFANRAGPGFYNMEDVLR